VASDARAKDVSLDILVWFVSPTTLNVNIQSYYKNTPIRCVFQGRYGSPATQGWLLPVGIISPAGTHAISHHRFGRRRATPGLPVDQSQRGRSAPWLELVRLNRVKRIGIAETGVSHFSIRKRSDPSPVFIRSPCGACCGRADHARRLYSFIRGFRHEQGDFHYTRVLNVLLANRGRHPATPRKDHDGHLSLERCAAIAKRRVRRLRPERNGG